MTVKVQTFVVVDMGKLVFKCFGHIAHEKATVWAHKQASCRGRSSKEMVKCDLAEFELTGLKTDKKEKSTLYSLSLYGAGEKLISS